MRRYTTLLPAVAVLIAAGCSDHSSTPTIRPGPAPVIELGDPRPDLTADELAAFQRGKILFEKRFKPSEGLGPMYNATSCSSCHSKPVTGGSADLYRNFYISVLGGTLPNPTPLPGLPSPVVPAFGGESTLVPFALDRGRKIIPDFPGFVTTAQRNSIPIFGTGLFEFVSNETIASHADPADDDHDGISGRFNQDGAGMGRFGVKAQSNNIELFTRAPLMNQMGITSDPFRGSNGTVSLEHGCAVQASTNPNDVTRDTDGVPDPEISKSDLGDLIAFSRGLAPPQPRAFDDAARRGEVQFLQIGCAKCHLPELASSRGPVRAYTDLLIHDMGPDLADGISFGRPQLSAPPGDVDNTASEFRTQPLWGVSKFSPYLHDGRALTLDDAIRMHGGEAQAIRAAYEALGASDQADLISFLEHL